MIKPHKPLRKVKTTAFNKNKFKGNYETITEADLETELWICEPITLSNLPEDTDKFLYQQAWTRWENGGRLFVSLVPYKETPKIKVLITSKAGDMVNLERDDIISAITDKPIDGRPTKRFFLNKDPASLTLGQFGEIDFEKNPGLTIYEENNFVEIINNDNSIKQWSLTLGKVIFYDGGEDAFYRNVTFYYGQTAWVKADTFEFVSYSTAAIGRTTAKSMTNKVKELEFNKIDIDYLVHEVHDDVTINKKPVVKTEFNLIQNQETGTFSTKKTQIDAHFTVFLVGNEKPKFRLPWIWEYLYLKEQFSGKYNWSAITDGSNSTSHPSNGIGTGNCWSDESINYKEVKSKSFFETNQKKLLHYFLNYTVEFGLPAGLSSHGATYMETQNDEQGTGLLGLGYESSSLNGARPTTTVGIWGGNSTIFAVDNAYDPAVLTAVESIKLFLSEVRYGKFYGSDEYKTLIINVLRDEAVYFGTAFKSEMSVLKNIETQAINDDIRKWNNDGDWNMYLINKDIIELANNLDTELKPMPSYPKLKSGILDFSPFSIRTNNTRPFNNKLLSPAVFDENAPGDNEVGINAYSKEKGFGEISVDFYSEGDISISLFENNTPNFWLKLPSDVKEGRSLSGGTMFTFL